MASSTHADRIRLVRDKESGIEALEARFAAHAYDLHRHEEWLVGVTGHGIQDFLCRKVRQRSTPGRVILMEPGEVHDGQAGNEDGFAYRMLYLPQPWLKAGLAQLGCIGEPGVRSILSDDPPLAISIWRACEALSDHPERLARDAALDAVLLRLRASLGCSAPALGRGRDSRAARRAREQLDALPDKTIGADALAREAGAADRFQLARAFRAAYGTSPHAYLVQARLMRARSLLAAGDAPADVAAACGFADQSHLGRWFRRAYGLTPAAYRRFCTGVPDEAIGIG